MAYIREIAGNCPRCIKQPAKVATHEVFNRLNAPCGKYCKLHAKLKQVELEQAERESDKALGER